MRDNYYLVSKNVKYGYLFNQTGWGISELSMEQIAGLPFLQRREHALGAFISGDYNSPKPMNHHIAIGGMDFLIREPSRLPKEPEINAYHYIFVGTHRDSTPFVTYGPFTGETIIGHWPNNLELISGYYS